MWLRPKRLSDYVPARNLTERIKRTRIVVIDDVETEFPFEILRDQGYAIDYWPDIKDLQRLETGFFDIIVLDIAGVGRKYDEEKEGVGILEHIKKVNPSQIVVAYSGQSFEPERIPFFKLADQFVPKPTNALTWKETIDDLIESRLTVDCYWESLRAMLAEQGFSQQHTRKLERLLIRSRNQPNLDPGTIVSRALGAVENVTTILVLVGKILMLVTESGGAGA